MKKSYGICKVLGENDFVLFIEYVKKVKINSINYTSIIVGRDIITGTRVTSMEYYKSAFSRREAANNKILKKGTILIEVCKQSSIEEMLGILKGMTKEDIIKYIDKVNKIKEKDIAAINESKIAFIKQNTNLKVQGKNLKKEKKRVKKIAKNV